MKKKTIAGRVIEKEKKKAEKKAKKVVRRILLGCFCGVFLLGTGYFLGVHHKVLAAMVKGEPLPEAPANHCLHR